MAKKTAKKIAKKPPTGPTRGRAKVACLAPTEKKKAAKKR